MFATGWLAMLLATVVFCVQGAASPQRLHSRTEPPRNEPAGKVTNEASEQLPAVDRAAIPRKNFIDELALRRMDSDGVPYAGLAGDAEFLRRVYLDLTGRVPPPEDARKFLNDPDADKRDKLIDSLVNSEAFADRWTYWFGDLFRNSSTQIGRGQNVFHDYIRAVLLLNIPYDQFVREMITAVTLSNYLSGPSNLLVRERVSDPKGGVNLEDTIDNITIATYRNFLGINLECVSCHDGAGHLEGINAWLTKVKREDFWRQAAMFGKMRLTSPKGYGVGIDDNGTGYNWQSTSVLRPQRWQADLSPTFLLSGQKPGPGENPRQAYAELLTSHPQFARAAVNLIWAELTGVGFVDPPFGFDPARLDLAHPPAAPWKIQPADPELLEALAEHFRKGHDFRSLVKMVVQSSTYQLSARYEGQWKPEYGRYPSRRSLRRLTAEQLFDSISEATGNYPEFQLAGTTIANGQVPLKVKYITQVRSPEDLGGIRSFLSLFGQSNRDQGTKVVKGDVPQALALLNHPLIQKKVQADKGSRLDRLLNQEPPLTNEQIVEELFLATLSRFPTAQERSLGAELVGQYRSKGAEDLMWILLTKTEFLFY